MQIRPETHMRAQAFAYLFAAIFFLTFEIKTSPPLVLPIFGGIFLGTSFFLIIAPFCKRLMPWASRIDLWLSGGLLFATLTLLIKAVVEAKKSEAMLVIIVAWVIILFAQLVYCRVRDIRYEAQRIGDRPVLIQILPLGSVGLSTLAIVLLLLKVNIMGNPALYLAFALIALALASLLQHH